MNLQISFDRLWEEQGESKAAYCSYAASFAEWADELILRTLTEPTLIGINQTKVLLLDKYFEWRSYVPRRHRVMIGQGNGHPCIFQVFETAYERLKVAELTLTPPLLFIPEPPRQLTRPEAEPVQIAGIFLGEVEE